MKKGGYFNRGDDKRFIFDDTMVETNKISEIYGKLTKYENGAIKYKIKIIRNKVIIAVKGETERLRKFRKILPAKYREPNLEKKAPYLGKR